MMAFNYIKPFCRKNRFLYLHCKKLPIVAKNSNMYRKSKETVKKKQK